MAELASSCDLKDIALAAAGCDEQFSGLGNHIYVAYPEDLTAKPAYDPAKAAFATSAFTFKSGKGAWKIRIKKQSAKISSTGNAGAKGYNVTLTFNIEKDVENAATVLRIMKNRGDVIVFAERPAGGYLVVYDPMFGTEVNSNYDTGDTPESDSGHTVTVTSNPNKYPVATWEGALTVKSEATPET